MAKDVKVIEMDKQLYLMLYKRELQLKIMKCKIIVFHICLDGNIRAKINL